jgi:hypothetical protein
MGSVVCCISAPRRLVATDASLRRAGNGGDITCEPDSELLDWLEQAGDGVE